MDSMLSLRRFHAGMLCKLFKSPKLNIALALATCMFSLQPALGDERLFRFAKVNDPNDFASFRGAIVNIIMTCYEKPPQEIEDHCRAADFGSLQSSAFRIVEAKPPQPQGLNVIFTKTPLSRRGMTIHDISSSCSYSDGQYKIVYVDKDVERDKLENCIFEATLKFLGFDIPSEDNGRMDSDFFGQILSHYTVSSIRRQNSE